MKFYWSPLSIIGVLFVLAGIYFVWAMFFTGGYPSYVFFIILLLGIVMLAGDYFLRKSTLQLSAKLIIQTLCALVPTVLAFLYFTGKIK